MYECVYVCECSCSTVQIPSEVRQLSFYHACPRVEVHIVSLGSFYSMSPMSHFASPIFFFFKDRVSYSPGWP